MPNKPISGTPLSPKNVLNPFLGAHWGMTEGAGTSLADQSGNGNAITLFNAPSWAMGPNGAVLNFNGGNQYGKAAQSISLEPSAEITYALRVKLTDDENGQFADVLRKEAGGDNGYAIRWSRTDAFLNYLATTSSEKAYLSVGPNTAYLNDYHWFVATYKASDGLLRAYVDGVSVGTPLQFSPPPLDLVHSDNLYLMTTAYHQGGTVPDPENAVNTPGSADIAFVSSRAYAPENLADLQANPYLHYAPYPIISFIASPPTLACGSGNTGTLTISWECAPGSICSISNGIGSVAASGSFTYLPNGPQTYVLTATRGIAIDTATISVDGPWTITPDVSTGLISYFNGGASFVPGLYNIGYWGGSFQNGTLAGSTTNGSDKIGYESLAYKITDSRGNIFDCPGHYEAFSSSVTCQAANAGLGQLYRHSGGPIGIFLNDKSYLNNIPNVPATAFSICGPAPDFSFSPLVGPYAAGTSVTISYTIANAVSASVDHGIGAVNPVFGSFTISPTVTTTYTVTAAGQGITTNGAITVFVFVPGVPANLTATAGIAAHIALTWTKGVHAANTLIYRAAASGGPYTLITTVGGTSYTDTTPIPGMLYYYVVQGTDGANMSAYSLEVSAASIVIPVAPVLSGSLVNGNVSLAWPPLFNAITYTILRSMATGQESMIASGIIIPVFIDSAALNGIQYFYTVKAVNSAGTSGASNEVTLIKQANTTVFN